MKLIYIDPYCSGLQVADCPSKKVDDIKKTFDDLGLDEDHCSGEMIIYAFVDNDGTIILGEFDYT